MAVKLARILNNLYLPLCLGLCAGSAMAQAAKPIDAGSAPWTSPAGLPSPAEGAQGEGAPGPGDSGVDAHKQGKNHFDYTAKDGGVPKDLAKRVGIDQKMDAQIPMGLDFKDESGHPVKLGSYFGRKPVLLNMMQFTCDMVCSAELEAMTASLNDLKFDAGKEFEIVTVSIDPRETPLIATDAREERLKQYKRPTARAGWHFLTGDKANIQALAAAIGFKYIWDEGSQQYVHPDGLLLVTPEGKVSRYFMQLDYNPQDLRFGIIGASHEKIGTVVDRIALSCFHYDPETGKYSIAIMEMLRLAGIAFVVGGLTIIGFWLWKEKQTGQGSNKTRLPGSPGLKKA